MSKTTIALEAAVAAALENMPKNGEQTRRQRAAVDRAFADILKLLAPRVRHFTRQYGLTAYAEDAEQCCAIAVHRAIEAYEPEKAQFTTFVNWQIRGELQSLRFRLKTDQRPAAKKVGAVTVSLHALTAQADGEELSFETLIEDEEAQERTESAASDYLADNAADALIDAYVQKLRKLGIEQMRRRARRNRPARAAQTGPALRIATAGIDPSDIAELDEKLARDRMLIARRLFEDATFEALAEESGLTKERVRQINTRAMKALPEIAARDPRFAAFATAPGSAALN